MAAGPHGRRQWPVVAIHGMVATTVLALVAVLALVVKPPAPPGIAAFAPQAAKPITKAPQDQSSEFGTGAGQCAAGQVCTGPSPTGSPTPRVSVSLPPVLTGAAPPGLQCHQWADGSVTQTFDPQSPPCIARWDDRNGNGGATSPGVSGSEIRVALPTWTTGSTWPSLKPIVDFVNTRFQLYDRKITVVPVPSQQANEQSTGVFNNPTMQRADAAAITQQNVFASFDFVDPLHYSWSLPVFRDVLTKKKIISLAGGEMVPYGTSDDLARNAPYEWTFYPPIDSLMGNVARMTCRQLVGKQASHSTDPQIRAKTRKFALVLPADSDLGGPLPGLSTLLRGLEGCGVRSPKVVRFTGSRDEVTTLAADFREMQQDDVTSMIYFPFTGATSPQSPPTVASNLQYRPEWVLIGWNQYLTAFMLNNPEDQTRGAFGVGVWNKILEPPLEYWQQSYVNAGGDQGTLSAGGLPSGRAFYNELLLLASGIQLAGPHLTPDSFAKGLRSTTFPNPGAATGPFYQGHVGFTAEDPTMVDDYVEFWLDTRMKGPEVARDKNTNQVRSNCYVALGRRWSFETWPTTDGFYGRTPCR